MAIFLGLPDALDLMVVCVEAGLGLDAAMRRVLLDDLHALSRHFDLPVFFSRIWKELAECSEPLLLRLENLAYEVLF